MEGLTVRRAALVFALVFAVVLSAPAVGNAGGTGDDPRKTRDVLSRTELAERRRLEAACEAIGHGSEDGQGVDGIAPLAMDVPYGYLYTPSHRQERSYWCGPATAQVIDDYLGSHISQSSYARYMRTTSSGTDFSRLDDCLRAYTGKAYYYYGNLTRSAFNTKVAHTISAHRAPLAADVKIVASVWPRYNKDHSGHIIPIEAFDWRNMTLRINDPYDEASYQSGGGATYGHRTYSQSVVWHGVYSHFRRAVIAAP